MGVEYKYVQLYDVQLDTWTVKSDFLFGVRHPQPFVLEKSRLFVTGGYTTPQGKKVYEYDFDNDQWIDVFELPITYRNCITVAYNDPHVP